MSYESLKKHPIVARFGEFIPRLEEVMVLDWAKHPELGFDLFVQGLEWMAHWDTNGLLRRLAFDTSDLINSGRLILNFGTTTFEIAQKIGVQPLILYDDSLPEAMTVAPHREPFVQTNLGLIPAGELIIPFCHTEGLVRDPLRFLCHQAGALSLARDLVHRQYQAPSDLIDPKSIPYRRKYLHEAEAINCFRPMKLTEGLSDAIALYPFGYRSEALEEGILYQDAA